MSIQFYEKTATQTLAIAEAIDLYSVCLTETSRPTNDTKRMQAMIDNASILIWVRDGSTLVGLCRALSDFSYVTYISDLAVHPTYQKQGIGAALLRHIKTRSPLCKQVLLSNTNANSYYPTVGFKPHPRAWIDA